jgi:hypothetical protein
MHRIRFIQHFIVFIALIAVVAPAAFAFEGRINAVLVRGTATTPLIYIAGTNSLRIEVAATNRPNPVDIVDIRSGTLTLLFPHNRSFVRVKAVAEESSDPRLRLPTMPMPSGDLPPGAGPRSQFGTSPDLPAISAIPNKPASPPSVSTQVQPRPGTPTMPRPMMPKGSIEKLDLKATGVKTNILGFASEKYELKRRGETMEVWATKQLLPYQAYQRNQPHRFGPRGIEEQWAALLTSRKLFPLRAILRSDSGVERFRFEVKSVTPEKLTAGDAHLFEPPSDYHEIAPLPL